MGTSSSETSANRHNSGKSEILIALQNDPRWHLLHSWFSKFPRVCPPGPPYKKRYMGKFWISFFYPTSVPRRHLHPLSSAHTGTKTLLFARHLIWQSMILWSVVLSVACLPPPFSPILRLLLLGNGYCYTKVSFHRILLEAVNFID